MIIQHNTRATAAFRYYNNTQNKLGKNLEKLSSGYKINRSADDAAGLAISEKMRAQIAGLTQAKTNAKDGISLVKTAEGAMQEIQTMLDRMIELATQSANGTYDDKIDREALQDESAALLREIDRISESANFNGLPLLNGTSFLNEHDMSNHWTSMTYGEIPLPPGQSNGGVNNLGIDTAYLHFGIAQIDFSDSIPLGESDVELYAEYNNYTLTITVSKGTWTEAEQNGQAVDEDEGTISREIFSYTAPAGATTTSLAGTQITLASDAGNEIKVTLGTGTVQVTDPANPVSIEVVGGNTTVPKKLLSVHEQQLPPDQEIENPNYDLIFQIGDSSEHHDQMFIDLPDMRLDKIGVDGVYIGTADSAMSAIQNLRSGVSYVSSERGRLGAYQNRLEHTYNNLGTMSENIQDSEATIRDVDIADEMTAYSKNNILLQAAQAMLAQANQMPQGVLQLLQ